MGTFVSDPQVLVVDDDPLFANLVRRVLARLGIRRVEAAPSGRAALDALDSSTGRFDLMLCDLEMAGMDGVELLRHLAERSFAGGIVVVSGQERRVLDSVVDLAASHDLNVIGALHKPFALNALLGMLEQAFDSLGDTNPDTMPEITVGELKRAIVSGDIAVHYQPQMAIASAQVTSVEALARWRHPDKGSIDPEVFVALAEQHGLVRRLSEAVLKRVLCQQGEWAAEGIDLGVSVNLPMEMLLDLDLADRIAAEIRDVGVEPERVTIEITETQLIRDARRALETLNRLRLKGVRLSIDDFGTGYSSLSQLRLVPFQELKVDKGFVQRAPRDPVSCAIVESSVDLARRLAMRVVAEGVETDEQMSLVTRLGCDDVQGYRVARPMLGSDLAGWLHNRSEGTPVG